jgi:hypothetical protein
MHCLLVRSWPSPTLTMGKGIFENTWTFFSSSIPTMLSLTFFFFFGLYSLPGQRYVFWQQQKLLLFGIAFVPVFRLNLIFFFFSAVCTFWIVLICWCQKWVLKNKKTSLTCISARKAIWKAPATTLPNTLVESLRFDVSLTNLIHTKKWSHPVWSSLKSDLIIIYTCHYVIISNLSKTRLTF